MKKELQAKLTPKQLAFCREYPKDFNMRQALIRAGYSPHTVTRGGNLRVLQNPLIAAELQLVVKRNSDRCEMSLSKAMDEVNRIAFANHLDYFRIEDGSPIIDLSKITREQASAISEITTEEFAEGRGEDARTVRKIKFKLHDKLRALELTSKYLAIAEGVKELELMRQRLKAMSEQDKEAYFTNISDAAIAHGMQRGEPFDTAKIAGAHKKGTGEYRSLTYDRGGDTFENCSFNNVNLTKEQIKRTLEEHRTLCLSAGFDPESDSRVPLDESPVGTMRGARADQI